MQRLLLPVLVGHPDTLRRGSRTGAHPELGICKILHSSPVDLSRDSYERIRDI